MKYSILIFTVIILSAVGFYLGRNRSSKTVNGEIRKLHSLPGYYGFYVALWCGLPTVIILGVWLAFQSSIVTSIVVSGLPPEIQSLSEEEMSLVINDIVNLSDGIIVGGKPDEFLLAAAEHYNRLRATGFSALTAVVLSICIAGLGFSMRYINPAMRARIKVEQTIRILMILSSTVAIFTTIGIVLSVLFESVRFFCRIDCGAFFEGYGE